jgi:hypothetical protein
MSMITEAETNDRVEIACSHSNVPKASETDGPWLLDGRAWDDICYEQLLALEDVTLEPSEFGFKLRHYWLPATSLLYETCSFTYFEGRLTRLANCLHRRMVRRRSYECVWREALLDPIVCRENLQQVIEGKFAVSEVLCIYNCFEQTYRVRQPLSHQPPAPEDVVAARQKAIRQLPLLVPPGPIGIGYQWHVAAGDDVMEWTVSAEDYVRGTHILIVNRKGTTSVEPSNHAVSGINSCKPRQVIRRGVTIIAWKRGVVLEDRFCDTIATPEEKQSSIACTSYHVQRLVRSTPFHLNHIGE